MAFNLSDSSPLNQTFFGGGWELIETQTPATVATIEFTSGFTSTYKTYILVLNNLRTTVDGAQIAMRVSTDGGTTWQSGASTYVRETMYRNGAALYSNASGRVSDNHMLITDLGVGNAANEDGVSGTIYISGIVSASQRTTIRGNTSTMYTDGSPYQCWIHGHRGTAEANDAIQFYLTSGNFESGEVALFGLKTS